MLEAHDLTFSYAHRPLFHGLSFALRPKELLHLKGPNGAGKSTLMAVIAGLLAPTRGTISYQGEPDIRRVMEYLPAEGNSLFLKMSGLENLTFFAGLRGQDLTTEQAIEALKPWGLSHPLLLTRFSVSRYSTGMKRRLALARLAISKAPVWLLDEPIYGLDQEGLSAFNTLLKIHLSNGGSAIVISHDLNPLQDLITHTLDLAEGRS